MSSTAIDNNSTDLETESRYESFRRLTEKVGDATTVIAAVFIVSGVVQKVLAKRKNVDPDES